MLQEATQESLQTAGLKGPPVCLPVCRKFHKHGGAPKAWFAEWAREVGLSRKDRGWHEVECLIEALWLAGSYDQLNVGALASAELCCRQIQLTEERWKDRVFASADVATTTLDAHIYQGTATRAGLRGK